MHLIKILLITLGSVSVSVAQTQWKLVWSDEFNASKNSPPDSSRWAYDIGAGGWGNHEIERYTEDPGNAFHDGNGHLIIRIVKTKKDGSYTSARLKTQGKFAIQYGKIEARIKIPAGQGIWPAFWMLGGNIAELPWPNCGEIDVMENIGKEPSTVHGTVHGPGYSGDKGLSAEYTLPSRGRFSDAFHVFAAEWSAETIVFSVDGRRYAEVTSASLPQVAKWVFDHPFFIILNVAVGGDWPGPPSDSTRFPQIMTVDWVRVWEPLQVTPK